MAIKQRKHYNIMTKHIHVADDSLKCAFCDEKPDELITGIIPHVAICAKCVKHIQENIKDL